MNRNEGAQRANGQHWAWNLPRATLEHYRQQVHRYFLRRLSCPHLAEDLAQEVCSRVLSLTDADKLRKPLAYIYGIAAHVLADFREALAREQQFLCIDSEAFERLADDPAAAVERDFAEMLDNELHLHSALATLPRTHAAVLVAHKLHGQSYREVAAELRLSIHTVEKYLTQAKARLRGVLCSL